MLAILRVSEWVDGALERIRTSDLCLRRAALYPAELRVHRHHGGRKKAAAWPDALFLYRLAAKAKTKSGLGMNAPV